MSAFTLRTGLLAFGMAFGFGCGVAVPNGDKEGGPGYSLESGLPDSGADGSSDTDSGVTAVDADGDGYSSADDCDDGNASVNPGATERCNGVDDDCDGIVDRDTEGWRDEDGDDYGTDPVTGCEDPTLPLGSAPADCDDGDATVHPFAAEQPCDDIDQDCDGLLAEVATVEGGASYATIQSAVGAAPDGGTVWVCDGVWAERLLVAEGQVLRIAGWSGDAAAVVLDGQDAFPILIAEEGADLTLQDLTFTRGYGFLDEDPDASEPPVIAGALSVRSGSLMAQRVAFINNRSLTSAGAVLIYQWEDTSEIVTFEDCTFDGNRAEASEMDWHGETFELSPDGGSVAFATYAGEARYTVEGCSFSGGAASDGGDLDVSGSNRLDGDALFVEVEISNSTFLGSRAESSGGAIGGGFNLGDEGGSSSIRLNNLVFADCMAGLSGGAVSLKGGDIVIDGSTFRDCAAGYSGGAVELADAVVTMQSVEIIDCSAGSQGGAVNLDGGVVSIQDTVVAGGTSGDSGGCLATGGWGDISLSVGGTTFSECSTGTVGGALAFSVLGDSELLLEDVVVEDSSSNFQGGGLYLDGRGSASLTITKSRFEGNAAAMKGGGIALDGGMMAAPPTVEVEDTTIRGNIARGEGGGSFTWGAGIEIDDNVELSVINSDLGEAPFDNSPDDLRVKDTPFVGIGAGVSFTCAADNTCIGIP